MEFALKKNIIGDQVDLSISKDVRVPRLCCPGAGGDRRGKAAQWYWARAFAECLRKLFGAWLQLWLPRLCHPTGCPVCGSFAPVPEQELQLVCCAPACALSAVLRVLCFPGSSNAKNVFSICSEGLL